jgi:hypothetical protein
VTGWTAHVKPGRRPVLVKEAFSWGAFLFGPLWLLARGAWIAALIDAAVLAALVRLPVPGRGWLLFCAALLVGLIGRDLVRGALSLRGYRLAHVLMARDEESALGRLLQVRPELGEALAGLGR